MDEPKQSDESSTEKPIQKLSPFGIVMATILLRILTSFHWAFIGGLGWGTGAWLAISASPKYAMDGGAIGFAVTIAFLLLLSHGQKHTHAVWVIFSACGGAAFGGFCGAMLMGQEFGTAIGGVVGCGLGMISSLVRQDHFNVNPFFAIVVGSVGAAILRFVPDNLPAVVPPFFAWMVAGALSLFLMRLVAEVFRRESVVEIGKDNQPIRQLSKAECCWHVVRESWSPITMMAWGWHGAIAGIFASYFAIMFLPKIGDEKLVRFVFVLSAVVAFAASVYFRLKNLAPQPATNSEGSKKDD